MTKTIHKNTADLPQSLHKHSNSVEDLEREFADEIRLLKKSTPYPRPEMVNDLINKIKNSDSLQAKNQEADLSTP